MWSCAHARQGFCILCVCHTRPPPVSPGAAPPQTHNCRENKVATHARVRLQREASFVCDVCGFFFFVCLNMEGTEMFISESIFVLHLHDASKYKYLPVKFNTHACKTAHTLQLCCICLKESLLSVIHRGFKTRRRLTTGFQVEVRVRVRVSPNIFHHKETVQECLRLCGS